MACIIVHITFLVVRKFGISVFDFVTEIMIHHLGKGFKVLVAGRNFAGKSAITIR